MRRAWRAAAIVCAPLAGALAGPALAEPAESATVTPPGERLAVTPSGVDMRSGQYASSATDLSIGEDNETGGLALTRGMNANVPGHDNPFANFSHNWDIMISEKAVDLDEGRYNGGTGPDLRMAIHFGGRSETFDGRGEQSYFTQASNNWRTTLTYSGDRSGPGVVYTYSATDGTVAVFRPLGNGDCSTLRRCAYVSQITWPDGTRFDFDYDAGAGPTRLRAVTSNRGYALLLQYGGGGGADANHVTSACAINLALIAKPANNVCPASPQAVATYSYAGFESKRRLAGATDASGATSSFTYSRVAGTVRMGLLRPGDTSPWLTNTLTERADNEGELQELVDAQSFADGATWNYQRDYSPPAEGEIPQVAGGRYQDPAGNWTTAHYGFPIRPGSTPGSVGTGAPGEQHTLFYQITAGPAEIIDPLGQVATSDYCDPQIAAALPAWENHRCQVSLLNWFTDPEGIRTELTYDGNFTRNVIQMRRRPKPGSTLPNGQLMPDIVTYATYSCVNNIVCNKPISRTDANGNLTNFTYDPNHGGMLSETGPAPSPGAPRPQARYEYAQRGAWLSNGAGGWTQAAPIWVRTATSFCRTSAATGNPAAPCATAGDEVRTTFDYGPNNGPNPLLLLGQAVTTTDNGVTTTLRTCFGYDARGRRISETQPNANLASCPTTPPAAAAAYTTATRYDAMGRVTGTITADPDGVAGTLPFIAVRNSYDGAGRLTRVENGTLAAWQSESVAPADWANGTTFTVFRATDTLYDVMGRKTRDTVTGGALQTVTQYSYDVLGRLECTAARMNPAVFGSLPASACTPGTASATNGPDRITRTIYDAAGRELQVREGVGTGAEAAEATWDYNLNGQITAVIDGNGNRAELRYDGQGRQDRWTFPSTTRPASFNDSTPATALATAGSVNAADHEEYEYDLNGNRTALVKRDTSRLEYHYDALNRVTLKVVPQRPSGPQALTTAQTRDVYYAYDLRGLQVSARFDSASGDGVTNVYNGFGLLASSSIDMGGTTRTLAYTYDRNGSRTSIVHPDTNAFTTAYDGIGRPYYLAANGLIGIAYTNYTAQGAPQSVNRDNSAASAYCYDALQRPSCLIHYLAGGGYGVWSFAYNPASQIASQTRDNDAYAWTGDYNVGRPYGVDGLNRYSTAGLSGPGQVSFDYDSNSNLAGDGANAYVYDIENRLVSVSGAHSATLVYDPLGRLHQVTSPTSNGTTRTFLYDGNALVAEYGGSQLLRRHVHNVGADVPMITYEGAGLNDRRWLYADRQGSIVAIAGINGVATTINRYDDYGIPALTNSGTFGYTGQIWLPEIGLYHYKARAYSPTLGRFLQTDPVGYADQFNLYAYVGNDPINGSDSSGTYKCTGSQADCDKIATYSSEVRQAARAARQETGTRIASSYAAALSRVAGFLGQPNQDNGVNVISADLPRGVLGDHGAGPGGTSIIRMDIAAIENSSGSTGAGTLAHEASHGIQERAWGPISSLEDSSRREVQANVMESLTNQYLDQETSVWSRNMTPQERMRRIRRGAFLSCDMTRQVYAYRFRGQRCPE